MARIVVLVIAVMVILCQVRENTTNKIVITEGSQR